MVVEVIVGLIVLAAAINLVQVVETVLVEAAAIGVDETGIVAVKVLGSADLEIDVMFGNSG